MPSRSNMPAKGNTERRSVFERLGNVNENAPQGTQPPSSKKVGLNAQSKGGNNRPRINDTASRPPLSETSTNPRPNKFFAERRISNKVKQLKAENEMAQNLADTALTQTQILLNEKAQLNSEKMRLEAELRRLSERLEMAERYASFTSTDCTIQAPQDDENYDDDNQEEEGSKAKRSLRDLMHISDSNDDTSVDCQVTQALETLAI